MLAINYLNLARTHYAYCIIAYCIYLRDYFTSDPGYAPWHKDMVTSTPYRFDRVCGAILKWGLCKERESKRPKPETTETGNSLLKVEALSITLLNLLICENINNE